jgi:hypothetical protein
LSSEEKSQFVEGKSQLVEEKSLLAEEKSQFVEEKSLSAEEKSQFVERGALVYFEKVEIGFEGDQIVDGGDQQFLAIFKKRWRLGAIGDQCVDVTVANLELRSELRD